jgi:lipopolysaccharide transport system ATP-binding protein
MTSGDICVSVDGVSKKFARSLKRSFIYGARDIGRKLLGRRDSDVLRPSEFWAVRGVSFELRRGQSIGIVGLNGSGKTTLLRMVSGILQPTLGDVRVSGRIAPMLALGAGFKPVLSGRENIFLNLSLLGVAERDIRARYESIVDFAELSESIEAPIGTYSSGMLARLGFACAVHTDPKILVVDEVLSVGDARFRIKCRNRINELRRVGTSMLLVSHSAIMIESLSDECLFMRKGKVVERGAPRDVLKVYEDDGVQLAVARNAAIKEKSISRTPADNPNFGILGVTVRCVGGETGFWVSGRAVELLVDMSATTPIEEVSINLIIVDLTHQPGETVQFIVSSRDIGWMRVGAGTAQVCLHMPNLGLRPGTYRLKVSISRSGMHDILDVVDDVRLVVRDPGRVANCLYFQPRDWRLVGAELYGPPVAVPEDASIENGEEF